MEFNSAPETAAARLKRISRLRPTLALGLGSGFQHVLTALCVDGKISCARIPGFPIPTISGHAGELIIGKLGDTPVLVLNGRAHFYEGHSLEQVTFPIRTLAACACIAVFIWRSAGRLMKRRRKSAHWRGWVPTRSG